MPREAWKAFVTSGDATRAELAKRAPGPAWIVGPERDAPSTPALGWSGPLRPRTPPSSPSPARWTTRPRRPKTIGARFAVGAGRDIELICANPDRVVQRGDQLSYCGGALADLYASQGGRVVMAGKPFAPILRPGDQGGRGPAGPPGRRRACCASADGVVTDVMGANAQALDCLFIAQGIHGDQAKGEGRIAGPRPAAGALLKAETAYARYAALELAW